MNKITIVGIGPGDLGLLTREAYEVINNSKKIYFRTSWHSVYREFESKGFELESFDKCYDEIEDFDQLTNEIKNTIEGIAENEDVVYCVLGNPSEDDAVTSLWLEEGKAVTIIPGISYVAYAMNFVPVNNDFPTTILNVFDFSRHAYDIHNNYFITNAYNPMLLGDFIWSLEEKLGDDFEIYVLTKVGLREEIKAKKVKLMDALDCEGYDHQTVIFVPAVKRHEKYNLGDLREIVETLRGKDGCPWDIEQTHESMKKHLLEEAYEAIEAIENEDYSNLEEELGDILFLVAFHSQLADEEGYFGIDDVLDGIARKMVYRHPHVFKERYDTNTKDVLKQWEELKDNEKSIENYTERLLNVPKVLPSLLKSYKIQKKASQVGFDWDDINGPLYKLEEEIKEVKEAIEQGNSKNIIEEIGDLLFSVVNVSRFLDVNPEEALGKTIQKFIKRFEYIEKQSLKIGKDLTELSLDEMDEYWEESKKLLN